MTMLPCDQIVPLLSAAAAQDMEPADAVAVETHLAACPACRRQAELFFRQDRALTELAATPQLQESIAAAIHRRLQAERPAEAVAPPADLQRRGSRSKARRAAVFVLAASLLVGLGVWSFQRPRVDQDGSLARGAYLQSAAGRVVLIDDGIETPVDQGAEIASGRTLRTVGEESLAVVTFGDGTRLDLGADTTIRLVADDTAAGKQIVLSEGFLTADVAPQPPGKPMLLSTPQAELVVLGTRFTLSGGDEATYVETAEGSVRVTRKSDGQSVNVDGGFETSVAAVAAPLTARSIPKLEGAPRLNLEGFWTGDVSPDGKTLAAATYLEGKLELRDVATGRIKSIVAAHRKRIYAVAFSPDGATLATGSADETVKLWDHATGRLQALFEPQGGWIAGLAFSVDGQTLTVLSGAEGSEDRIVTVWDLRTRAPRPNPLRVNAKTWAFSPDGRYLAGSQFKAKTVTIWDVAAERPAIVLDGRLNNVFSMAFSHDGKTLAVDNASGIVGLWDVATGKQRSGIERRGGRIFGMAFSPDDRVLATGHQDGTVRVSDLTTLDQLAVAAVGSRLAHARALSFTSDGKKLLTREIRLAEGENRRNGAVQVWDLPPNGEPLKGEPLNGEPLNGELGAD